MPRLRRRKRGINVSKALAYDYDPKRHAHPDETYFGFDATAMLSPSRGGKGFSWPRLRGGSSAALDAWTYGDQSWPVAIGASGFRPAPRARAGNWSLLVDYGTGPSDFRRALFQIERSAFHSYGLDAHSCGVLCAASTGCAAVLRVRKWEAAAGQAERYDPAEGCGQLVESERQERPHARGPNAKKGVLLPL